MVEIITKFVYGYYVIIHFINGDFLEIWKSDEFI